MRTSKSDKLKSEAIALGLCEQWQSEWAGRLSDAELIGRYKKGIDFAIEHDWPSVEYIKSNFNAELLHKHGIYCDEELRGCVLPEDNILILNGHCTGRVVIGRYSVATIYVRHTCNLDIRVRDFARVRICLYDNANVSVVGGSASDTYVYRYSDGCVVRPLQNVVIKKSPQKKD